MHPLDFVPVIAQQANTRDEHRPQVIEHRRTSARTVRENIALLVDSGSLVEYGSLAIAARRRRSRPHDLVRNTREVGLLAGVATINAAHFGPEAARCMVLAYEYGVRSETRRRMIHKKIGRMLIFAEQWRMPLVFCVGGGGGWQNDTDRLGTTCLDELSLAHFAKLSGLVPVVGVIFGDCFAGNESLLRGFDAIIATKKASIGMACPALFDARGLGACGPAKIGPGSFEAPNGSFDVLVEDDVEATRTAQKYMAYFQGPLGEWEMADQRWLQRAIPKNRLHVYDVRTAIDLIADQDSVLELRRDVGMGMITALIRIEGKPFGLVANDPRHVDGAIDSAGADKASRFLQLCGAFDLPIVSLCDTPGFMVKSEAETTAMVSQASRMSAMRANLSVPLFGIVLRKCCGLGAQFMIGGGLSAPVFTAAWPTGEFGGVAWDPCLRLSRGEIDGVDNLSGRGECYRKEVAEFCSDGRAVSVTSLPNIDVVIHPTDTRRWIMTGLRSLPVSSHRASRERSSTDEW